MEELQTSFQIRQAEIDDTAVILEMIRELADYEKLSDKVMATEELLKVTLFGTNSPAEVQLVYDDEGVIAYALYYRTFSTFLGLPGLYLEDLYVREAARSRGIGEALLRRLAQRTLELGGGRLEWSVLNWNKPAIDFYKKMGADTLDGWTTNRVAGESLEKLATGKAS